MPIGKPRANTFIHQQGGDDVVSDQHESRTPHIEHQANHFSDVRNEIIAIGGDMHGLERRIMDKIDENRDKASGKSKWIIGSVDFINAYPATSIALSQNEHPMYAVDATRAYLSQNIRQKPDSENVVINHQHNREVM